MKKTIILIMFILLSPLMFSCANGLENPDSEFCELSTTDESVYVCQKVLAGYFNTTISLKLYYHSDSDYVVSDIFVYFEDTVSMYDKYLDKYNSYDDLVNVHTINHSNDQALILDDILYNAINFGINHSEIVIADDVSLFNMAMHPILDIWHEARNNSLCDEQELGILYCPLPTTELEGVSFNTDIEDISMNDTTNAFEFLKPNMGIDLGGYAKGYVVDVLENHLTNLDITYLINLGNSNVFGRNQNPIRSDGLYYIALEKPVTEFTLSSEYYHILKVPQGHSVVTSGVNQRFFKDIDTGEVYHHIIDPRTNYPGGEVMSLTIITNMSSAMADILSTSIFLLDLESAKDYVNQTQNLEAVWYLEDGTIKYSDNFEQYIFE